MPSNENPNKPVEPVKPADSKDSKKVSASPAVDVVQQASLKADGTPDQTPGFKYLDPEEGPKSTQDRLEQQAASNQSTAEAEAEINKEA